MTRAYGTCRVCEQPDVPLTGGTGRVGSHKRLVPTGRGVSIALRCPGSWLMPVKGTTTTGESQ